MISPEEAVARAREALQQDEGTPGRAWLVERLDRPQEDYYLIVLGANGAAVGVATVTAGMGAIQSRARLAGNGSHPILSSGEALALAASKRGVRADAAEASLVWRPCAASRSALYPVWRVREGDHVLYIDQQGEIRDALDFGGPGG